MHRFLLVPFHEYESKRKLREKRRMYAKYIQQRRQEALVGCRRRSLTLTRHRRRSASWSRQPRPSLQARVLRD